MPSGKRSVGGDRQVIKWRDRILLEGMVFHGYVGVNGFEKEKGQPFQIDLELLTSQLPACESDRLDQTIDYGKVYELVSMIVQNARCDLIERLAGMIAEEVLDNFPQSQAVDVTVRKPKAPVNGEFSAMGVRIYRERRAQI